MKEPNQKMLKKYADILIKFALNSGEGVKPKETVALFVPDVAKPLLVELYKSVLESDAYPIVRMIPTGIDRVGYELSNDDQLKFFPKKYKKAFVDLIDHQVGILSDPNPSELEGVDPQKIMMSLESRKTMREWLETKEYSGNYTWTLALYPTSAMAKESGITLEEYWDQVIKACYLDKADPIKEWQNIMDEQERIKARLDNMKIDYVHVEAAKIDLKVKIGKKRKWLGGSGRNIPSYEIFTSPDWRGTEGYIYFNQPLYMYGNKIKDVELWFENGKVVKAKASRGEKILQDMIKQENADKLGEFSLTDKKASRITKFMANTLFDENMGGRNGNMHLALGLAYKDAYDGDPSKLKKEEWKELGYNQSSEHKDIVTTAKKKVTAYLENGSTKVIYADGEFQI